MLVPFVREKIADVPPVESHTVSIRFNAGHDLLHLGPDSRGLYPSAMVLDQELHCFLLEPSSSQPSRRLGAEEDCETLICRKNNLKETGYLPGTVAGKIHGAISNPCAQNQADIDGSVVKCRDTRPLSGISKFGDQDRRGNLTTSRSKTEEKLSGDNHLDVSRKGFHDSHGDDNDRAIEAHRSAAQFLDDKGSDLNRERSSELGGGSV